MDAALEWAQQAGRNAAELAQTDEQLMAADIGEWQQHVVEPAVAAGVIPEDEAWDWAADQGTAQVREVNRPGFSGDSEL